MFQLPTLAENPDGSADIHVDAVFVALVKPLFAKAPAPPAVPAPFAGEVREIAGPDGVPAPRKFDPWQITDQGHGAWIPTAVPYRCPPGDELMRLDPPRSVDVVERI